jgi:hypothetical protein
LKTPALSASNTIANITPWMAIKAVTPRSAVVTDDWIAKEVAQLAAACRLVADGREYSM